MTTTEHASLKTYAILSPSASHDIHRTVLGLRSTKFRRFIVPPQKFVTHTGHKS